MAYRFTARAIAAEVDHANDVMQAGVAEDDSGEGVREVSLSDNVLAVSLDPASLDDLELEKAEIEALLDAPEEDIERLREVLGQVLAFGREDARPERVDL
ncbi:hypothetical protein [Streptomyces phaeochromogenes]|uniref:hypothetical protein n=1 Tax=Streptomyces phaeochromogenes TaxID=1923 RepID=UPI0006E3970B|nr:hypothetical protein [Streptomyces phaeochromogenes]